MWCRIESKSIKAFKLFLVVHFQLVTLCCMYMIQGPWDLRCALNGLALAPSSTVSAALISSKSCGTGKEAERAMTTVRLQILILRLPRQRRNNAQPRASATEEGTSDPLFCLLILLQNEVRVHVPTSSNDALLSSIALNNLRPGHHASRVGGSHSHTALQPS